MNKEKYERARVVLDAACKREIDEKFLPSFCVLVCGHLEFFYKYDFSTDYTFDYLLQQLEEMIQLTRQDRAKAVGQELAEELCFEAQERTCNKAKKPSLLL